MYRSYPSHHRAAFLLILLGAVSVGGAHAEFVVVDDFEGLAIGPIDDQNGWFAASNTSVVVLDPQGGSGRVLAVTTDSTRLYKNALIPKGSVRTMFMRFRFAGQQTYSFGMSDQLFPSQFGDFEVELSMSNASNELRINDDGTYQVIGAYAPDTWYNVWMFIDHDNDEAALYLHDRPGEPATEDDRVVIESDLDFDFRYGTSADLKNFFIKTGGGSGPSGPLYLDDICIEDTDALNLLNPSSGVTCLADVNGDGVTNLEDLNPLIAAYGSSDGDPSYDASVDFDGDGIIGLSDLAFLLTEYGCGE